jgi:hypothetical protein
MKRAGFSLSIFLLVLLCQSPAFSQAPAADPENAFKNNSVLLAGIVSNLGDAMDIDPPLFVGGSIGFEMLFGRKGYFGTGLHFVLLGGPMPDNPLPGEESYEWLYFLKTPVFGGYRLASGKFSARIESGLAYAFEPQSVTPGWNLEGLIPAKGSLSALARVKAGTEIVELELGYDRAITDMFSNRNGFRHRITYLGARINF